LLPLLIYSVPCPLSPPARQHARDMTTVHRRARRQVSKAAASGVGRRPPSGPPPLATPAPGLLAYLNPPRLRHRTHTGHRTLLDILPSPLSLSVAQKLDAGAPRTRRIAAVPDHLPRRRWSEVAEEKFLHCPDIIQPPLAVPAGEFHRRLFPAPRRRPVRDLVTRKRKYRFGLAVGPLCQPILFFFFSFLPPRTKVGLARPAPNGPVRPVLLARWNNSPFRFFFSR
jgi:hypothetical protein